MAIDRVDTYYYTAVQSIGNYSQPQGANVTEPTYQQQSVQSPSTAPTSVHPAHQPDFNPPSEQEQPVRVYFFDSSIGQFVNLLV